MSEEICRILTPEEMATHDVYLCDLDSGENISLRNLLKIVRCISENHFEVCIKEMGYKKEE